MVHGLAKVPSARLLKHVVRCYLRLSENPRFGNLLLDYHDNFYVLIFSNATVDGGSFSFFCFVLIPFRARDALRQCLPEPLRDSTFANCLKVPSMHPHLLYLLRASTIVTHCPG